MRRREVLTAIAAANFGAVSGPLTNAATAMDVSEIYPTSGARCCCTLRLATASGVGDLAVEITPAPPPWLQYVAIEPFTPRCEIRAVEVVGKTLNFLPISDPHQNAINRQEKFPLENDHPAETLVLPLTNPIFDVKLFGAKGDYDRRFPGGAPHDDTEAIQAALNHRALQVRYDPVRYAYRSIVYFPAGTYLVTTSLNVTNRVDLTIEGQSSETTCIYGAVPENQAVFDLLGSRICQVRNLCVYGRDRPFAAPLSPGAAFLIARTSSGQNAGQHLFERVALKGIFAHAGFLWVSVELSRLIHCRGDVYAPYFFHSSGEEEIGEVQSIWEDIYYPPQAGSSVNALEYCHVVHRGQGIPVHLGHGNHHFTLSRSYFATDGNSVIEFSGNSSGVTIQNVNCEGDTQTFIRVGTGTQLNGLQVLNSGPRRIIVCEEDSWIVHGVFLGNRAGDSHRIDSPVRYYFWNVLNTQVTNWWSGTDSEEIISVAGTFADCDFDHPARGLVVSSAHLSRANIFRGASVGSTYRRIHFSRKLDLQVDESLQVGKDGTPATRLVRHVEPLSFGLIAPNSSVSSEVGVSGAQAGDHVSVHPLGTIDQDHVFTWEAFVTSENLVTLLVTNRGQAAGTPLARSWSFLVLGTRSA